MTNEPLNDLFYAPVERDLDGKVSDTEAEKDERAILAWIAVAFLVEMGLVGWAVWSYCRHRGLF